MDTVPEEIGSKLEDMIGAKDHREKTLKILQMITHAGYTLQEESIRKLSKILNKHSRYSIKFDTVTIRTKSNLLVLTTSLKLSEYRHSSAVSQILMNLSKNGVELPQELASLSELFRNVQILRDITTNYESKLEAIREVLKDVKVTPRIPDVLIEGLCINIKKHPESELGTKCYKLLVKVSESQPELLDTVDYECVVHGINHPNLKDITISFFKIAVNQKIKFKPGVLALLSKIADPSEIIPILNESKMYLEGFSVEDS